MEQSRKSIPAQLKLEYRDEGTSKEQAFVTNTGRVMLNVVSAEYKYFFITSDYSVLTRYSIQNKMETDTGFFNTVSTGNLIKYPSDINNLFGIPRNFALKQLAPEKETLLEISPSSVHNAIALAEAINAQVFTKWKIKYHEELSNKQNIAIVYIWMLNPNLGRFSIGIGETQRVNLEDVSGGQKIIDAINNYEQTTMEVIFDY